MNAIRMWVRADLRTRWRSWLVLGLLAGATFGLAAAGLAGARRTERVLPTFVRVANLPTAAVLANDSSFGPQQRDAVAALPEVRDTFPFLVAFTLEVVKPAGFDSSLVPVTPAAMRPLIGALVAGRMPDPRKADEVVVDQNAQRKWGLGLGATMLVRQSVSAKVAASAPPGFLPTGVDLDFQQRLRVVGIAKSTDSEPTWTPSSGFYAKYGARSGGFVNDFVALRHGEADLSRFQDGVQHIVGHPINIQSVRDLFGLRKAASVLNVERNGLLLFALAVILGGGVLVGQALVRAVTAGAADLATWRAIGADRRIVIPALAIPAMVSAATAAVSTIVVAVALSSRFPISIARHYDLDLGTHADWFALGIATFAVITGVLVTALLSAWWRATRTETPVREPSTAGNWVARAGLPASLLIGSRLAVEPGRGRRAVPVRSALVGAIVGVLGVVACFTFRAGINDVIASPARSGVVWDFELGFGDGPASAHDLAVVDGNPQVASVLHATWARAVRVNGATTPAFGTQTLKGHLPLVVLSGRAPRNAREIAFAPVTLRNLHLHVGDVVKLGNGTAHTARVVGTALLPATSHTDYDQSAWLTAGGLRAALPPADQLGNDAFEDYILVRWAPHARIAAGQKQLAAIGGGSDAFEALPPVLPSAIVDLGQLRTLPFALGVFFGLLACATVAHALVTTVRRRKHDLAVLRALGFTRHQSRVAIAWQATLLAIVGLVIGIPLGIATGRLIWRSLADTFPVVYVPPLALLAVLVIVPTALVIANLLAAGPAHAATRIRPAEALRTE